MDGRPVIVTACSKNLFWELKVKNLKDVIEAKSQTKNIEVEVIKAPDEYQDLCNVKITAYFDGEIITLETNNHGKIVLRQTGFIFPKHP